MYLTTARPSGRLTITGVDPGAQHASAVGRGRPGAMQEIPSLAQLAIKRSCIAFAKTQHAATAVAPHLTVLNNRKACLKMTVMGSSLALSQATNKASPDHSKDSQPVVNAHAVNRLQDCYPSFCIGSETYQLGNGLHGHEGFLGAFYDLPWDQIFGFGPLQHTYGTSELSPTVVTRQLSSLDEMHWPHSLS